MLHHTCSTMPTHGQGNASRPSSPTQGETQLHTAHAQAQIRPGANLALILDAVIWAATPASWLLASPLLMSVVDCSPHTCAPTVVQPNSTCQTPHKARHTVPSPAVAATAANQRVHWIAPGRLCTCVQEPLCQHTELPCIAATATPTLQLCSMPYSSTQPMAAAGR
jgi:hypothetical protein